MNHVENMIPALVDRELAEAIHQYGENHSLHEGYAVLLEELDETRAAMKEADASMELLWEHVKRDNGKGALDHAGRIERYAVHVAAEAIQAAAMARKMRKFCESAEFRNKR